MNSRPPRRDTHAVVRKDNETAPTFRCTARGCGWNGRQRDAIAHVVANQWSEFGIAPREGRIGDVSASA